MNFHLRKYPAVSGPGFALLAFSFVIFSLPTFGANRVRPEVQRTAPSVAPSDPADPAPTASRTRSSASSADDRIVYPEERVLHFDFGVRRFDYLEGDGAGDSEKGTLPGLGVGYQFRPRDRNWFMDYSLEGLSSHTTYQGSNQKQTVAVTQNSDAVIIDFNSAIGLNLADLGDGSKLRAYTGLGFHFWKRGQYEIVSGIADYREDYTWWVLPLGFLVDLSVTDRLRVELNASARLTFAGQMKAYLSEIDAQYSDPTFDLGAKVGARAELPITYAIDDAWGIGFSPWFEYSRIGRSSSVNLSSPSGATLIDPTTGNPIRLLEPSSRTYQYGATVSARWFL